MLNHEEILDAYRQAAAKAEGHPKNTRPFVRQIDRCIFVKHEVERPGGKGFFLTLAEVAPGACGQWNIFLQTQAQIERQVLSWVKEQEDTGTTQAGTPEIKKVGPIFR
jgi:hypothetical protein